MASAEPPPYAPIRVLLHWLSAIVIVWGLLTGFGVVMLDRRHPLRIAIDAINPQLATLLVPPFAVRILLHLRAAPWRRWNGAPAPERLAILVHAVLYVLVALVLLSGLAIMGRPWSLLGLLPMPVPVRDAATLRRLLVLHGVLCAGLAGLVCLHVLAVIRHHAMGRPVLGRMALRLRRGFR